MINETRPRKIVPLVECVSMGQITLLEEIVAKGLNLNINEQDSMGYFAAIVAAEHNDLLMLKFLIENGADLTLKDGSGRTVRGWALKHCNTAMLKLIDITLEKQNLDSKNETSTLNR